MDIIEEGMTRLLERGPNRVPTHTVQGGQPHHAASVVAQHVPLVTQAITISSACAAGLDAIGLAADLIRRGKADLALCGGTDAPISPMTFACLAKTGLLTTRNEKPEEASRPFDVNRDSGVISEGAGMVVVENLDHALARGVVPYLEILGYASRVDTDLDVSGSGFDVAMEEALANASRRPAHIDYICAHGPGHPAMDRIETAMIKKVFGPRAWTVPISSIKGVIGNPLSAAGALQVIACALMIQNNIVTPTANLDIADPECDLDYVPRVARNLRIDCALINSHGMGGGNSSIVVRRMHLP
jgi:3-oxoacyl-[acyl-carrier-protein] synthase II